MLRISKLADYGTVIMVYLANHPELLCNARDIADQTHLKLPTVSKLLKRLTGAGLLVSVRGVSGGYRLQREAAHISIAQIIYALEDQKGLVECSAHQSACSLQHVCGIQGNWRLISQSIEAALDSVSLEALTKPILQSHEINMIHHAASRATRGAV